MSLEQELVERYRAAHNRLTFKKNKPQFPALIFPKPEPELSPQSTETSIPVKVNPDLPSGHSLREIVDLVCEIEGLSILELRSQRRSRRLIDARQIYYWLARKYTLQSYPAIARFMGGRDHTTAMHGQRMLQRRITSNPCVDEHIRLYEARLSVRDNGDNVCPHCGQKKSP